MEGVSAGCVWDTRWNNAAFPPIIVNGGSGFDSPPRPVYLRVFSPSCCFCRLDILSFRRSLTCLLCCFPNMTNALVRSHINDYSLLVTTQSFPSLSSLSFLLPFLSSLFISLHPSTHLQSKLQIFDFELQSVINERMRTYGHGLYVHACYDENL